MSAPAPSPARTQAKKSAASSSHAHPAASAVTEPGWHLLHSALPADPASIPVDAPAADPSPEPETETPLLRANAPQAAPGEKSLEAEADSMAERAARTPVNPDPAPNRVYRRLEDDLPIPPGAPPSVREALRSPGQPLDRATRNLMEQSFGRSFANVRIHAGPQAEASAAELNAQAYTVGSHIVFGQGKPRPDSLEGRRLLAHELTHVARQAEGCSRGRIQTKSAKPAGPRAIHFSVKVDREMNPDELLREFVRQYYNLKTTEQVDKKLEIWHWENTSGRRVTAADVQRKFLVLRVVDYSQLQMSAMSADQQKEINRQTNDRFWAETHYKERHQLGNSPEDQEMARTWLGVRTDILHENEQLRAIDALDDDIKKILFAGGRKLTPDEYDRVLKLAGKLSKLTPAQRQDYMAKINVDSDNFDDMEKSIDSYMLSQKVEAAEEEKTDEAAGKLFGMEDLYKLYREKNKAWAHSAKIAMGGGYSPAAIKAAEDAEAKFTLALKDNNFASERDFLDASNAFRLRFRAEAVHVAMEILARYEHTLYLARKKYSDQSNAAKLVSDIGATQAKQHYQQSSEKSSEAFALTMSAARGRGPSPMAFRNSMRAAELQEESGKLKTQAEGEVVQASGQDPLVDPAQLGRGTDREKLANMNPQEVQQYMLETIQDREDDLAHARHEFREDPDRIFSIAGLVQATKQGLQIGPDSIYSWIIDDYIEEEAQRHLFSAIVMGILALILAFLVPGGGWVAAAALVAGAGISTVQAFEAIQEYKKGETDYRLGFIEDEPSLVWVVVAVAAAALDMGMATSAVLKASAPALKELEGPLKAFSEATDAETAAKRLEDLRAKIAEVEGLDKRVKAALDAKAAAELGLKKAIGQVAGRAFAFGGGVDPTPILEGIYYGIKKGVKSIEGMASDAEMVKLMGDVTKMPLAAREEIKTAFNQVKKIVELGAEKGMPDETILHFVDRMAAQRSGGEGAFEVIAEEMSAWKPPTYAQVQANKALAAAHEDLMSLRRTKSEAEAALRAGPKTPEGKPDLEKIKELREELEGLDNEYKGGKLHKEGLISKTEREYNAALEAAEKAGVDPKKLMRQAFDGSEEREKVIEGVAEDQVGKLGGGLRTKPTKATVDHIVSIKQISEMDGFSKLTLRERNLLAVRQDNLIVMDASANFSKGERSWAAWRQASNFYDDVTREAMMAKEADLRKQIQDWIKNQVKGRP